MALGKNASLESFTRIVLVFSVIQVSFAMFSQPTQWDAVAVQKNSQGTWCYLPAANAVRTVACNGASSDFATVMDVHLNQGLAIAYYNGIDNTLLGGANYSLPAGANMPIIRLCVSGLAGDGYYYETICVNAVKDNQLAGHPFCEVALGQKEVTDGCYEPNAVRTASSSASTAMCTGASGGYSSMSVDPAKFVITSSSIFVAVIVVRTLLLF